MTRFAKLRIIAVLALAGSALIVVLPTPFGWPQPEYHAAIVSLIAIILWASGALPHGVTAAAYLVAAIGLGLQPADTVLSGFGAGIFWLVSAGIVIGVSIKHTGLGARIAGVFAGSVGESYLSVLIGVAVAAAVLSFLMPSSMGRTLTMVPIVLALADRYGFEPGQAGRSGMVMVAAAITFIPSGTILTGLMPSILLTGAAESLYGIRLTYGEFLLQHYPVMGLLRAVVIVLAAWLMFDDKPNIRQSLPATTTKSLSGSELVLTSVLLFALLLWFTDFVHGIAPYWIAASAAVMLFLCGRSVVPRDVFTRRMDYGALLYVVAVLAMGSVITGTGLAADVGTWLTERLPIGPEGTTANIYWLSITAALAGVFVTNPAVPVVLSPLAVEFAAATGLSIETVLMTQVVGFSNILLPYQGSPVLVAIAMGKVPLWQGTKMLLVVSLVTFSVLLPLEIAWWSLLGQFAA